MTQQAEIIRSARIDLAIDNAADDERIKLDVNLFVCSASMQKIALIARALEKRLLDLSFQHENSNIDESCDFASNIALNMEGAIMDIDKPEHPAHCLCDSCTAGRSDDLYDRMRDLEAVN